jgi:hypothetical protein
MNIYTQLMGKYHIMKISDLLTSHTHVAQQALTESIQRNTRLLDNPFRIFSEAWFEYFRQAKMLTESQRSQLHESDQELLRTQIGEFALFEGAQVPLDVIMQTPDHVLEAEYQGKTVQLNKPKRGGPKKYYVYVMDPKTDRVKRVTFGSTELSVKIQDPARRASFAARHKCAERKDKTKASYWSCRLPRFTKSLGLSPVNAQWW